MKSEIKIVEPWINFTDKVKLLLVPRKNNRPLDQYLKFRDEVFLIVQSNGFKEAINGGLTQTDSKITNALILELQAVTHAIEVAKAMENPKKKEKWWDRWGKKLLENASTAVGSVKDIGEHTPFIKNGLTLFQEAIDLYKAW